MAVKATARNGRSGKNGVYNSNHNTLEATRAKEDHIDHERTKDNQYAYWDIDGKSHLSKSFDSKKQELEMYGHFYADSLEAKNARYRHEGHADRQKEIKDIYNSKRTAPFETLFQIDKEGSTIASPEQLWRIASETMQEIADRSNGHFRPLNLAMHLDETTNHAHGRGMFMAKDRDGNWEPNQTKALEQMGYERPDPTKPQSRYNNALVSFSDALRKEFYDRCEREGIQIDREPQGASKRHVDKLEYKRDQLVKEIAEKDAQLAQKDAQIEEMERHFQRQLTQMQKHYEGEISKQQAEFDAEYAKLEKDKELLEELHNAVLDCSKNQQTVFPQEVKVNPPKKNWRGQIVHPGTTEVVTDSYEKLKDQKRIYPVDKYTTQNLTHKMDQVIDQVGGTAMKELQEKNTFLEQQLRASQQKEKKLQQLLDQIIDKIKDRTLDIFRDEPDHIIYAHTNRKIQRMLDQLAKEIKEERIQIAQNGRDDREGPER